MKGRWIRVHGQVQGVGFRRFVWQLARHLGLRGEVMNDREVVLITVAGDGLGAFEAALREEAPALARVDVVESEPAELDLPEAFEISSNRDQGTATRVAPDGAICADCLTEIRNPGDRRFGYPFANCANCGPRFSILRALPYDRANTSMAPFAMCADCAREHATPADRRFLAQPVACSDCGPHVWLERRAYHSEGDLRVDSDVIATAAEWLREGKILSIKGIGGFHVACDAISPKAVALLRKRKRRPTKPLALMGTLDMIAAYAVLDDQEANLLSDPAAPIVLLKKASPSLPERLAPGQSRVGWMLPHAPLHHLLLDSFGRPLVMTSGNFSGEPQVIGNDEARETLFSFVDAHLMHDREIVRRLDDGVERMTPHGPMLLRRGRGRAPGTLPLPAGFETAPQVVAFGARKKSAICLIKSGHALLSHHLGDLDEVKTLEEFTKADADYRALFDHSPAIAACDLHQNHPSRRHATERGLVIAEVQHHHAHFAACLAENLWPRDGGAVAGIILDGMGLGPDGTIWGGEVLLGDYAGFERVAHLAPTTLLGSDVASWQPWRNALARLDDAGLGSVADRLFAERPVAVLRKARDLGLSGTLSSSAKHLFDAVAALAGFCAEAQSFEDEAAMWLEACAADRTVEGDDLYPFGLEMGLIDPAPTIRAIVSDLEAGAGASRISARFHAGLAAAFCGPARACVERGEACAVALSGECFQNALLLDLCLRDLRGVPVLIHTKVPANDGGLALGQAVIAAARVASE